MSNVESLKKYFHTGTAEGDRAFLDRAYISHEQLADILSIEEGTLRILVGNKGTGKTAILEWLNKVANNRNLPTLLLRPDDLDTRSIGAVTDIASLKRGFYESLVNAIAVSIGSRLKGYLKGDAATLYNAAMAKGAHDGDFITKFLPILTAISVPVAKINGVQLAKELSGTTSSPSLIKAINVNLLKKGSLFFLLIDDTDQVAAPDDPVQLNRIWALLLAVRRLAGECPFIRCVVSLRSEIWIRLVSESKGQRDQTDHMRDLVISLRASDELMEKILRRRLSLAAEDLGKHNVDPYPMFFKDTKVRLPTSEERRPWDAFILKSARERPRDAIQLVAKMASRAKINKSALIGDAEADEGMKEYSRERVDDLSNEFAQDCSTLRQVIETFSRMDFEIPFETLRVHLKTIGSGFSLNIRNSIIKPSDDGDALRLLRFLHETGFINPKVNDMRQSRNFRHISYQDDPGFVEMANWGKLQATTWEVHPAFRSFLLGIKQDVMSRK